MPPEKASEQEFKAQMEELAKKLALEGKLVRVGWIGYRMAVIPMEATQIQVEECQRAFMAGASHLFFSIMSVLDPEGEPTDADVKKLELIHRELKLFNESMKARYAGKMKRN